MKGDAANERGIGAKVKVFCKGQQYYQEQFPVRGFQSSSDPVLTFGIGKDTLIDSVLVIWPKDSVQKIDRVTSNQTLILNITEAKGKWVFDTSIHTQQTVLAQAPLAGVEHHENDFNDFTIQGLLPNYPVEARSVYRSSRCK